MDLDLLRTSLGLLPVTRATRPAGVWWLKAQDAHNGPDTFDKCMGKASKVETGGGRHARSVDLILIKLDQGTGSRSKLRTMDQTKIKGFTKVVNH